MKIYKSHEYDDFQTSPEILSAIETMGKSSILYKDSDAYRIWSAPTPTEQDVVLALAWVSTLPEDIVLNWGNDRFKRGVK